MFKTMVVQQADRKQGSTIKPRFRYTLLLLSGWMLGSMLGCRPDLSIQSPTLGAMLPEDADVEVLVDGVTKTVRIEALNGDPGEWVDGDKNHQVKLDVPADYGMGFVSVETKRSPKVSAVRSWHQGVFLNANEVQHNIATGRLDPLLLNTVTDLVEQSLIESNLARYIDNPVVMDAPLGDLSLDISDSRAEDIVLTALVNDEDNLHLRANLTDVRIEYQASHDALNWLMDYGSSSDPIYGVGTFETVSIEGQVNLPSLLCEPDPAVPCEAGNFLEDVVITHSSVNVNDPNCEFLGGWIDLCGLVGTYLEDQLPYPLANAAEASTAHVLKHLVQSLDPQLEVQFDQPIQKELLLEGIRAEDNTIVLEYSALISALEPKLSSEGQGVLKRSMTTPGGRGICLGQPAINALAFAAWDAGNFKDIVFDNDQLVAFGMPNKVPWSNIRKTTVETTLPPLLEFREGSAWLDIGGIRAVVETESWGDAILYTAGQVPVKPGVNEKGEITLVLNPSEDGSRDIILLGVGFEEAHGLLDRGDALEIIEAILPGLMSRSLLDLVNLSIAEIVIPPFDDSESNALFGHVRMDIDDVQIVEDAWCVPTTLEF